MIKADVFGCPLVGDLAFEGAYTAAGVPTNRFALRDMFHQDPVTTISGIFGYATPPSGVITLDCGVICDPITLHSFDKYQEALDRQVEAGKCASF